MNNVKLYTKTVCLILEKIPFLSSLRFAIFPQLVYKLDEKEKRR